MKQFDTLADAAEYAASLCTNWLFAYSNNERYDRNTLEETASIHDQEAPIDEGSFYVVAQSGAIGLCEDGEDIDWLFLSSFDVNEALPEKFTSNTQIKFCPTCGTKVAPGYRFCVKCGNRLN